MTNDELKTLVWLCTIGLIAALGKLLNSNEQITFRLVAGRMLLGGLASMVAGAVLLYIPNVPTVALFGVASALGIGGSHIIEAKLRRWGGQGQ